jgi:hypothetical protein
MGPPPLSLLLQGLFDFSVPASDSSVDVIFASTHVIVFLLQRFGSKSTDEAKSIEKENRMI